MALMVARFLRFYHGYDDETVIRMSARRFFVLNAKISRLSAEEEATALAVTHNSKPGDRLKELIARMQIVERSAPAAVAVMKAVTGEARYESQPGEIAALRERQKVAAVELKRKHQEWLAEQKAKQGAPPANQ